MRLSNRLAAKLLYCVIIEGRLSDAVSADLGDVDRPQPLLHCVRITASPYSGFVCAGSENRAVPRPNAQNEIFENDNWRKVIAEQEASGQNARPFCRERGIGEYSFYKWRKRLRQSEPVRFALVETAPAATDRRDSAALELVLPGGERLRIGSGVDAETLGVVLEALRS